MTSTDAFVAAIAKHLVKKDERGRTLELAGMVVALLRRVEALEQRPTLKYSGVWMKGLIYSPGEFCTLQGSLWHCSRQTTSRPGTDATWTLAVKQGTISNAR